MGIGIYGRDGTPLRTGDERVGGDPWMTDVEVQALAMLGRDDLRAADDLGPRHTPADLHASLRPFLPETSLAAFIRAYQDAYAEHPDDLVPQVLLGQPIEADTRLTRVHLWMLLLDGFVGPAAQTAGIEAPGALIAQAAGRRWGAARNRQPALRSATGSLTAAQLRELTPHLSGLAWRIGFDLWPGAVHEGHGGPGTPARLLAFAGDARAIVSVVTGDTLLALRHGGVGQPAGLPITFKSDDRNVLDAHGSLDISLPATMPLDGGGAVVVHYRPKREAANGQGVVTQDVANLYATVDGRALIERFYLLPSDVATYLDANPPGEIRTRNESFPIRWHTSGIEIEIGNDYDVSVGASVAMIATAHRKGEDRTTGTLARHDDGTYRGVLEVRTSGKAEMVFATALAGTECIDAQRVLNRQFVYVIGRKGPPPPARGIGITNGGRIAFSLHLTFYPLSDGSGAYSECQGEVEYHGPDTVDGRRLALTYIPINDARWTDPTLGYTIYVPADGQLVYRDTTVNVPAVKAKSIFDVTVTNAS